MEEGLIFFYKYVYVILMLSWELRVRFSFNSHIGNDESVILEEKVGWKCKQMCETWQNLDLKIWSRAYDKADLNPRTESYGANRIQIRYKGDGNSFQGRSHILWIQGRCEASGKVYFYLYVFCFVGFRM